MHEWNPVIYHKFTAILQSIDIEFNTHFYQRKGIAHVGCRDKRHCMVNLEKADNAVGQDNAA